MNPMELKMQLEFVELKKSLVHSGGQEENRAKKEYVYVYDVESK